MTVGISLESLKTARTQIGAELKSWKFPEAEKVSPIDPKQLSDSKKFATELTKEFGKLGTAIGKGDIANISKAYEPLEKTAEAASFSSVNLRKLAESSKFYNLQAESQGRTLGGVRSELSTYNRALSDGSVTLGQVGHKYGQLNQEYKKLAAEQSKSTQKGGLDFGRLVIWAAGWTLVYGAIRGVTTAIANTIKSWVDFEQAMARVATVTRQVGMEQKAMMSAMSFAALDYSRKTTVAATDVAKVMYHLGSAGLNASEQMQGFEHVLALTVGTLGNVDQVSRLVASSYILFGDSITQATTISEKFQYITDVLGKIYAEHQVELSEIASAFTYVGGAASLINIKFEELVGTIGFLNDGMLKGSKAGTSLMATFVALGSKTDKLREYFGIVWDISKPIDFLGILQQMKTSIGETVTSTIVFSELMQIFGTRGARAIVQILQRWDDFRDAIKMTATDIEGAAKKMQEIIESTVGGELTQIKNQLQAIGTTILGTFSPQLVKMLRDINEQLKGIDLIELSEKWGTIVINIIATVYDFMRNIALAINLLAKIVIDSLATMQKAAEELKFATIDPTGLLRLFRMIRPTAEPTVFEKLSTGMEKTIDYLWQLPEGADLATTAIKKFVAGINEVREAYKNLHEEQDKTAAYGFTIAPGLSTEKQIATLEKMYSAFEKAMIERVNLEGMTTEEFSRQVDLLNSIRSKIDGIKATEKTYADLVAKTNAELERNYKLDLLRARSVDEYIIKNQELINIVEKYVDEINKSGKSLDATKVRADVLGMTFEELAAKYRGIFSPETLAEFRKGLQEITLVFETEIGAMADQLKSTTVDFIKNILSGTADVKDFVASIVDAYRSAFAEQLGEMLASTGIFSGMAQAFLSPIQKARKALYDAIVEGCRKGAQDLKAGVSGGAISSAGGIATTKGSAFDKLWASTSELFGSTKTQTDATKKSTEATGKLSKAISVASQAAGIGMGLYAGYQGVMAQRGQGAGMGALGGALSGAMAGSMFGPVGTVVGGIVGAIGGLVLGGKKAKAPEPEIRQQTLEIKSAINISNKELQLVNRNLDGIRRAFEGYWMPRSAFFSERLGVEERFNLDRQRGS